jgi:DNA repair protein RadC
VQSKNANIGVIFTSEQGLSAALQTLRQKDADILAQEEKFKKYIEKANTLLEYLQKKSNPESAEVSTLLNLFKKYKIVEGDEVG